MKTTAIPVHNKQKLEVFVEKRKDGFELWVVGPTKLDSRAVLDHHLTHDDLEKNLGYLKPGDLIWRDAGAEELPVKKHQGAVEAEATIAKSAYWDFEVLQQSVSAHFGAIALLPMDRKELNAAKKALLGRWTDGAVSLSIEPNNQLGWSCTDLHHPLNVGELIHGHAPNWWNFAMWRLALMNDKHKCGTHTGIIRVDEGELHIAGYLRNCLAHILYRDG